MYSLKEKEGKNVEVALGEVDIWSLFLKWYRWKVMGE